MLGFLDVHYRQGAARAACVLAADWADGAAARSVTTGVSPVEPYAPGLFYRRELPALLAALKLAPEVDQIVIDGYVWLDGAGSPGLGAHLFRALGRQTPVVGIAKSAFKGSAMAIPVVRGSSRRPLYVTSVGLEAELAAEHVRRMHGAHRIPTLVGLADRLSRE